MHILDARFWRQSLHLWNIGHVIHRLDSIFPRMTACAAWLIGRVTNNMSRLFLSRDNAVLNGNYLLNFRCGRFEEFDITWTDAFAMFRQTAVGLFFRSEKHKRITSSSSVRLMHKQYAILSVEHIYRVVTGAEELDLEETHNTLSYNPFPVPKHQQKYTMSHKTLTPMAVRVTSVGNTTPGYGKIDRNTPSRQRRYFVWRCNGYLAR